MSGRRWDEAEEILWETEGQLSLWEMMVEGGEPRSHSRQKRDRIEAVNWRDAEEGGDSLFDRY